MIVKSESKELIPKVDAIIFDIDGVLIDVSNSFRKTIIDTVQFYFSQNLRFKNDEKLVIADDIKVFKEAGGFNNDWELTEAIILFYLAKSFIFDSKDLAILRYQEPFLQDYIVSGVREFEQSILEMITASQVESVRGLWNKPLIRQIFQELYAGDKCIDFYGFQPQYFKGSGSMEGEVSLLDNSLISLAVGIITGRTLLEAKEAIKFCGLEVSVENIVSDDGHYKTKPDPQSLMHLSDKMGFKNAIYIGDSADDFQLVENYNSSVGKKCVLSAMVGESSQAYAGADIIASSVNEVLKLIND